MPPIENVRPIFRDRRDAGRQLAGRLRRHRNREDVLVLALPRGGVPVGYEVAQSLGAPLDVFLVRKLGVPGHEELAMGAIATGGVRVLNREVTEGLHIPQATIEAIERRELFELARRERLYRGSRPLPIARDHVVILVDDGLATGSTMLAAVEAVREFLPARIVVAVPVGSIEICQALRNARVDVVCAFTPEPFLAVGVWYQDFAPTSDDEVRELLEKSRRQQASAEEGKKGTPRSLAVRRKSDSEAVAAIRGIARRLGPLGEDDELLERIGNRRFVLIGEASHGTHEFYRMRADLTRRLIEEKGFCAVAVEADWPDSLRVDRYTRGEHQDRTALEALGGFQRFPQWMWRNTVVYDFIEWLRAHNAEIADPLRRVGFFGLDLYGLHASIEAVIQYLDRVDPEAARRARERYSCFDHFGEDGESYGRATSVGAAEPCEDEVVQQLLELQNRVGALTREDGAVARNEHFYAEQNARLAMNAEAYYRSMFRGRVSSWNLRDRHMAEMLEALIAHLSHQAPEVKVVVWAHNSHLGDARATSMGQGGELNLGQLARERFGNETFLIGFTTHSGTVTAAHDWGDPAESWRMRPSLEGSHERLFHDAELPRFWLPLADPVAMQMLRQRRLERAIGVIYRPETERQSHYFDARMADQFDAVIHVDETHALEPLPSAAVPSRGEPPETYPSSE